jgi:hypothetical protein
VPLPSPAMSPPSVGTLTLWSASSAASSVCDTSESGW